MEIAQYEILLVNLDPAVGGEMRKTRPCVVISPSELNDYLITVVVAPITNTVKPYPTRIEIKDSKTTSWIALDQIKTVDKRRIVNSFGLLANTEIERLKSVLKETYVD